MRIQKGKKLLLTSVIETYRLPYSTNKSYFFTVDTRTDLSTSMGDWILFYIRYNQLLLFDSFVLEPMFFGLDIEEFYREYQ